MKTLWLIVGVYTIGWGLWVGNPFWDAFTPGMGLYSEMSDFMPEWAWGLHAIVIGAAIIYGNVAYWPRGIMWGYIAGTYHWAMVAAFYAMGDWRNTACFTALFAVAMLTALWRASRPAEFHPLR
jgi:hypothetical protein